MTFSFMMSEPETRTCERCGKAFETKVTKKTRCDGCIHEIRDQASAAARPRISRYEVPQLFRPYSFPDPVRDTIAKHRLVVLCGPTGTCKTSIAHHGLSYLTKSANEALFLLCGELGTAMVSRREEILQVPVLAIDDLGRHMSPASVEAASAICEYRTAHGMLTMLTTNLPLDRFAEIDERLHSRLHQFEWIKLGGQDKRKE